MKLITAKELADRMGVDVRTVRRWSNPRRPIIPVYRVGRTVRFNVDEVERRIRK